MTASPQRSTTSPVPRQELVAHLEAIMRKRAEHREIAAQHQTLQAFLKVEAEAQARVDALRQKDIQELAERLVDSSGTHVTVDHSEQSAAESDFARAKREADVARACEPAVAGRATESFRQIAALEQGTLAMVANVMIGEADALAAGIEADAKRLRSRYAILWGLHRYVGDTPAIRKQSERVRMPLHPDHIVPDLGELMVAADAWRDYAARLAVDPSAEPRE